MLVEAGLARRVKISGAEASVLVFDGRDIARDELEQAVRRALRPLVPAGPAGAPASWIDVVLPDLRLGAAGDWTVTLEGTPELQPGRNPVACRLTADGRPERFSVVVEYHRYGEVATARTDLRRDTSPEAGAFAWTWRDLAAIEPGRVTDRTALAGASLVRDLKAGDELRESDLVPTPVIRAGEAVDLTIRRGGIAVIVRAVARQPGSAGQTIPVRNEITGRLVNATVAGPGRVEWRR
jgi:flagella basal body P-ring formation protein FlgA